MLLHELDQSAIRSVLDRRIGRIQLAPHGTRAHYPPPLRSKGFHQYQVSTANYFAVYFLSTGDFTRAKRRLAQYRDPFPGLITQSQDIGSAFRFERSHFAVIKNCSVANMYSFSLGPDSSLIVSDHVYSMRVPSTPQPIEVKIPLGYILSYGDEITPVTLPRHLDELIAYSFKSWRERNERD